MGHIGYNTIKQRQQKRDHRKACVVKMAHWLGHHGWKLLLVVAVLAVLVWQGWFFIRKFSPTELRTLKTIDISGNRMLTWDEILQTAGLETGMPMSEIDADSVRSRLLSLPLLHDARVDVGFFWKVTISVEETVPLMVVLEDDRWKAYSERGLVLPVSITSAFELPVATIEKKLQIKQIAAFLAAMRSADGSLYGSVSQVAVDEKNHAMKVLFRNVRFPVLFPLDRISRETFANYRVLVEGLSQEMTNLKSLDMRFDGFAYARPVEQEGK